MAKRHGRRKMSPAARDKVSDKISILRHEGDRPDVAVAKSLSMQRAGRLRKGGRYVHVRGGKRRHHISTRR